MNKLLLPNHAAKKFPKGISYDYSCSSVQDALPNRICIHCSLYFGSIDQKMSHVNYCRAIEQPIKRAAVKENLLRSDHELNHN